MTRIYLTGDLQRHPVRFKSRLGDFATVASRVPKAHPRTGHDNAGNWMSPKVLTTAFADNGSASSSPVVLNSSIASFSKRTPNRAKASAMKVMENTGPRTRRLVHSGAMISSAAVAR